MSAALDRLKQQNEPEQFFHAPQTERGQAFLASILNH